MPPSATPGATIVLQTDAPSMPPDAVITPKPSPTREPSWFDDLIEPLGLGGVPASEVRTDDTGDAIGPQGQPAQISPDLDIFAAFGGLAMRIPPPTFQGDGFLSCDRVQVLCSNGGGQPPDGYFIVAAIKTGAPIELGVNRGGQVAMVIDRMGFANAGANGGEFAGGDLVVIGDLSGVGQLFVLEWKKRTWQVAPRRGQEARIVIVNDTALFVVPTLMEDQPTGRFLTFERIPPDVPGGEHLDFAPGQIDSFFDVYVEIQPVQ